MRKIVSFIALIVAVLLLTVWSAGAQPDSQVKAPKENLVVVIKTSLGDFKIELDAEKAPITVENFLGYVDDGYYNGTIFHRVIPDFMIQGGGFSPDMKQKDTREPIKNESSNGLKNDLGTVAMARTNDPHSATSQFFVNLKDNDFLNRGAGYAVFGRVSEGMDVIDEIAKVKTGQRGAHGDVPDTDVAIESAARE